MALQYRLEPQRVAGGSAVVGCLHFGRTALVCGVRRAQSHVHENWNIKLFGECEVRLHTGIIRSYSHILCRNFSQRLDAPSFDLTSQPREIGKFRAVREARTSPVRADAVLAWEQQRRDQSLGCARFPIVKHIGHTVEHGHAHVETVHLGDIARK